MSASLPVDQRYLFEARQMQALSLSVHIPWSASASPSLVAGVGLLVFADPSWAHGVGAVSLLACAATVFAVAAGPPEKA
jgi:hypothetical protein